MPTDTVNSWPGGVRRAMHQQDHKKWNAENYPGTLQLCTMCNEPTGRCEEDSLFDEQDVDQERPLCELCLTPCGRCGAPLGNHPTQMCSGQP